MILGIDEAGRGCWAGPLVACAVVLPAPLQGLADSKTLIKRKREALFEEVMLIADVGIGVVLAKQVDDMGLTKATSLAMQRAVKQITVPYQKIIIDGNYNYLQELTTEPVETIIKADAKVQAVSAASIVAKVTRDRYMTEVAHKEFSYYGFDKHVGYGTKLHNDMLAIHGVCKEHRLSYKPIKAFI